MFVLVFESRQRGSLNQSRVDRNGAIKRELDIAAKPIHGPTIGMTFNKYGLNLMAKWILFTR